MDIRQLAAYAPRLYFDKQEPFYPVRVGVSVLHRGEKSPSFPRRFEHLAYGIDYVIERRLHRFTPSFEFVPYELAEQENLFVPWKSLYEEIPDRIEAEPATIRHTIAGLKEPLEG